MGENEEQEVPLNRAVWLTFWACMDELPLAQLAQVLAISPMRCAYMKTQAREYLAAAQRTEAARMELYRPKTIGGPWLPSEDRPDE